MQWLTPEMHSVQTWELHIEYNCRFHNVTRCTRIVAHRTASDDQWWQLTFGLSFEKNLWTHLFHKEKKIAFNTDFVKYVIRFIYFPVFIEVFFMFFILYLLIQLLFGLTFCFFCNSLIRYKNQFTKFNQFVPLLTKKCKGKL